MNQTDEPRKPGDNPYSLTGQTGPYWLKDINGLNFPSLQEPLSKDVIVLGGGIAGLTCAYLLQRAGLSTAILEARKVLTGVTGHTTAKITPAHGLYHYLFTQFGEEGARQYAAANQAGFDTIASLVEELDIACDYIIRDFYLFGAESQDSAKLKEEGEAAGKAGLNLSFTREVPLPFSTAGGLVFPGQAQFHPQKYLRRLLEEFIKNGGEVFENTPALEVTEKAKECRVRSTQAEASGRNVVVATHFPFMMNGLYYIWMNPQRSYVLALRNRQPAPAGMFYQITSPYTAIRSQPDEEGELLLISGGDHRTGHGGDTRKYYQQLEELARKYFDVESIAYHWSTQDNFTLDLLPFMGRLTSRFRRTFIATGFGGWGMTNSTAAALVILDLIQGKPHPWPILSPQRHMPWHGYRELTHLNWVLVKAFVVDHLASLRKQEIAALPQGEGRVLRRGFKRLAVSRGEEDELQAVSPVCTHLGCVVRWNPAEQSWDCPCHGSRFSRKGVVLHGPALSHLTPERGKIPPTD
jgi:glycine/D-amino acid oxidase-like deaminating enzyme/nitrite reductase/ring-hydroxylating ferredoxin subunit